MGKGGKSNQISTTAAASAAVLPSKDANNKKEWKSPFTPEAVDPKVAKDGKIVHFPTKGELRNVIPPHCFERSLPMSMYYVLRDLVQGCIVVYITAHVLTVDPPDGMVGWILWRLGWNLYGVFMMMAVGGLWVLAHECGHGAFSKYPAVNGLVGWVFHSIMLVPYFSWAFSHAKHHRRTNDLVDGETHVPSLPQDMGLETSDKRDQPYERMPYEKVVRTMFSGKASDVVANILLPTAKRHSDFGDEGFAIYMLYTRLVGGWQAYLLGVESHGSLGNDGKPIPKGTFPDHFRPHSRLFPKKMYWKVIASDIGIFATIGALVYFSWKYSFRAVWFWYFGPYIWINCFLVSVTWMHHTDPSVPQFDPDNWNWVKGTLAGTIDRPMYGWLNWLSHNISSTHIVHHLFHEIPHYHAVEATKAIREFLEPKGLYNYDDTPPFKALWRVCHRCHFVDSYTDGVQYYKSMEDVPPMKKETKKTL